jgi:hypothetical protein
MTATRKNHLLPGSILGEKLKCHAIPSSSLVAFWRFDRDVSDALVVPGVDEVDTARRGTHRR